MAPRCWHWAGLLPQENFMGEGVCKEWLSMIMVGFWNKRALLANVFVHLYYYSSHRHVPLLLFMSVKLAFRVWLWGPISSPFSHQKLATNPRSPPVGLSRGNLAVKFCSVAGARCLQCWRFFVRVLWPRFGSILRTQIWTHVSISLLRLNIGVQKWTHFRAHFMDPNLVRQPRAENA